jgi:hypothetical protein
VSPLRVFELVSWFSLPTVMFGGFSLLRLLTRGQKLTPFQVNAFRAGHAHAGVLLVMSLVFYKYLADTTYGEGAQWIICVLLAIGIIAQSGGFFVHMAVGKEGQPSAGTRITMVGAAFLAAAVLALAVGLAAYHAGSTLRLPSFSR